MSGKNDRVKKLATLAQCPLKKISKKGRNPRQEAAPRL